MCQSDDPEGCVQKRKENRTADQKADHTKPCPCKSSLYSSSTRKPKEVPGKNWSSQLSVEISDSSEWLEGRQKDILHRETGRRGILTLRAAAGRWIQRLFGEGIVQTED